MRKLSLQKLVLSKLIMKLMIHCQKELNDFLEKQIISASKSPFSCDVFTVNYIASFIPSLSNLLKPLHDRIKKSPPPWTNTHTNIVKDIKVKAKDLSFL